jgi:hypothetical protein
MISIEVAANAADHAPTAVDGSVGHLHRPERWATPTRRRTDVFVVDLQNDRDEPRSDAEEHDREMAVA